MFPYVHRLGWGTKLPPDIAEIGGTVRWTPIVCRICGTFTTLETGSGSLVETSRRVSTGAGESPKTEVGIGMVNLNYGLLTYNVLSNFNIYLSLYVKLLNFIG